MITNNQLKKNLGKDGLNLSEDECNNIRGLLVKLATIEYEFFSSEKNNREAGRVVEMCVISNENDVSQNLNKAA